MPHSDTDLLDGRIAADSNQNTSLTLSSDLSTLAASPSEQSSASRAPNRQGRLRRRARVVMLRAKKIIQTGRRVKKPSVSSLALSTSDPQRRLSPAGSSIDEIPISSASERLMTSSTSSSSASLSTSPDSQRMYRGHLGPSATWPGQRKQGEEQ